MIPPRKRRSRPDRTPQAAPTNNNAPEHRKQDPNVSCDSNNVEKAWFALADAALAADTYATDDIDGVRVIAVPDRVADSLLGGRDTLPRHTPTLERGDGRLVFFLRIRGDRHDR